MYGILAKLNNQINKNEKYFAVILILFVVLVTVHGAAIKPLDHDEIYSLFLSDLGSPINVYEAIKGGADTHPPTDYMARSISLAIHKSNLFLRLPTIVLFTGWLVCMFLIGRQFVGPGGGLLAMTLGLQSAVIGLSTAARMYVPSVFVLTLAIWLWYSWDSKRSKVLSSVVLAGLFFIAPVLHYYLPFWMLSVAAGELMRTIETRTIRKSLWASMAAIVPGGLLAIPFAMNAKKYSGGFWTSTGVSEIWLAYGLLMKYYLPLLLAVCIVYLLFRDKGADSSKSPSQIPLQCTVLYLICLPITIWVLSQFTRAYSVKYFLGASVGISLFGLLLFSKTRLPIGVLSLLCALSICVLKVMDDRGDYYQRMSSVNAAETLLSQSTVPIVTSSSNNFLENWISLDGEVRSKFLFIAHADMEKFYTGWDTASRGLLGIRSYVPGLSVVTLAEFEAEYTKVAALESESWFVKWARDRGHGIEKNKIAGKEVTVVTNRQKVEP